MTEQSRQLVCNIHKTLILSFAYMCHARGYQHYRLIANTNVFMSIRLKYKPNTDNYDISLYDSISADVAIDLAIDNYKEQFNT